MSPLISRKKKSGRKRGIHPLIISAIVILVTVFVTFYAFNGGLPFIHKFTLYAVTNNSVNVRQDSPVRIAGIDVGTVSGVSPGPGQTSKVAFTVNGNGQPIHTDATVWVRDRLFLEGGYYLDLNPGSATAPVAKDGFTIPLSNTRTVVQFYKVLSTFDSATRQSLDNILNNVNAGFSPKSGRPQSDSGAGGLKQAIPALTPVFKDTALITRALTGTRSGDVGRLLRGSASVASALASTSAQLEQLVTGFNATSSALASSDGALAQSVSGLDKTLQIAPSSLAAVDRALPPVRNLALALDPSLKLAPPILDSVTSAVRQLGTIVAPVERRELLTSLRATFQQFPSLLTELGGAFPITKQVTDCLATHVTPILQSSVPDGALTSRYPNGQPIPVWQDFVHFLPGVAGASGNFDANGPYTRTLIGAGLNSISPITVPGLGTLGVSNAGSLSASPTWVGTLPPSAFRPDVRCTTQPVPSLAVIPAASDAQERRAAAAAKTPIPSATKVLAELKRVSKAAAP
ncbi:MAG TPA: MlaD family protein [Solirubrobacteraceae bacterium]|jgi:virulence factor Mce-like protein|nr:MlaD family protein [Solirubrobacteraceae bacterium]